jgi:hypothetical protein
MLNSRIKFKHPFHLDVFMFALKQQLEGLKRLCIKIGILFTIHVVLITLVDLENKHEVAHKYILL